MKTEKITRKTSSKTLNIVAGKVESLRINNDIKKTVRVYDKGYIGVEGRIGNADFAEMEKAAIQKLEQKIEYPETHDKALVQSADTRKHILAEKDFIPEIEKLLENVSSDNPDFLFSNKIAIYDSETDYENSDGTKLNYKGNQFMFSLVLKHKGSANIMDESVGTSGNYFNAEELRRDVKTTCDAFLKPLPQIKEDEITVIADFEPLYSALQHLVADLYFNNASLFGGKLGEKIFSEKLNVVINRDPQTEINVPFFDIEGVVNEGYKNYIIKNGVFERTVTYKKTAKQYGTQNLGSADADYNGVPNAGAAGLNIENTAESLSELVKGKALFASVTSGGDMTSSGDVSLPVQVGYLYEDGKLLGKLPELTITTNIFDLFGKDFVGVCEKGPFRYGETKYLVYKAKAVNKAE